MTKNCCAVIYPNSDAVVQALGELQTAGCDLRQVSVIARGCQGKERAVGIYRTEDRIRFLGQQDSFWNDVWSRLADSAFFWEPDFGPLAVAGQIVNMMVHDLERVDIGNNFSLPGTALFIVGVPRSSIKEYEQAIKAEKFLLLFHGEQQEVERVCDVLHGETQQVTVHRA